MTIRRIDGQPTSPFLDWIRNVPGLDSKNFQISITDNDVWVHQYSSRDEKRRAHSVERVFDNLMLVEIKSFYKNARFAQRDTLSVVDCLLRKASINKNGKRVMVKIKDNRPGRAGCSRLVRCFAVHLIQMSADRPDNSDEMIWDNKYRVSEQELISLLRFDLDPDHPKRKLQSRRHHLRPAREMHPVFSLFSTAASSPDNTA